MGDKVFEYGGDTVTISAYVVYRCSACKDAVVDNENLKTSNSSCFPSFAMQRNTMTQAGTPQPCGRNLAEVVRKNRKGYKGHPSLNNGRYRLEGSRLFYTPKGSGEQAYTVAVEAGILKLITPSSVQVFQRKAGRFAE